jgi:hypothetical protein
MAIGTSLFCTACGGEQPAPDLQPAAGAPVAARVTIGEFGHLRWLEGRWRGAEGDGAPFYEAYGFVDDSTIRSYEYTDSTLVTIRDSGSIRLRGDTVTSGGAAPRYVVVRFDTLEVEFAPLAGATNGFTWTHEGQGAWRARLTWDSAGTAKERVYQMRSMP